MHYVSPFHFLGSSFEVSQLKLERKKKLAELELSPTKTVNINGRDYSKDDLVALFDQLMQEQEYVPLHQAIFEEPSLVAFLEKGEFIFQPNLTLTKVVGLEVSQQQINKSKLAFTYQSQFYEEPLLSFIAPYYRYQALEHWKRIWKENRLEGAKYLFLTHTPILNEEEQINYEEGIEKELYKWYQQAVLLEQYIAEGKAYQSLLNSFLEQKRYRILNLLPQQFSPIVESLASVINNVGVELLDHKNKKTAHQLFKLLRILNVKEELQTLFKQNYEASEGLTAWGIIKIILFIIFILAKIGLFLR